MNNEIISKPWCDQETLLLAICEGDRDVLSYPFDYGDMDNKDPYVLVWYAGRQAGCFSVNEESLAEYIMEKSLNGDDSLMDIYNKNLKRCVFKINVTVEEE